MIHALRKPLIRNAAVTINVRAINNTSKLEACIDDAGINSLSISTGK